MTDEEIAREAAEDAIVLEIDAGTCKLRFGTTTLDSWLLRDAEEERDARDSTAKLQEEFAPFFLAAIVKARRQYPVPSPVGEETIEGIAYAHRHTSWRDRVASDAIGRMLTHIAHQDALISWLASEGEDEAAMIKLREAMKR